MSTDYVLAGYRVAPRYVREEWQDSSLPKGELVSMSGCVVDVLYTDPHEWDDWFGSPGAAERARVQSGRSGSHVLGVGFAVPDVPEVTADITDSGSEAAAGTLLERLARREPAADGEPLGFELVGYECGLWHTWTCIGGLVREVYDATGVRPGEWGLVQDEQDARRAAAWLTESGAGEPKVFYWVAAKLVDVPV